ncbi:leucine-rich repeat and guanylate kinase domain-containing protein-like [Anoplophora glabripennis]|uniref:leucine-rich repeat and guanylate kinase domain-containing protein-like n=1 Tax=Anoplophora glabripennis TaxID=217634 RepID=UPI000C78B8E7|nr:leucine-rich repeat and guanylate kinase domain-containing protein-like [Anoplophora glabripennis]
MSERSSYRITVSSFNQLESLANYQPYCETPKCQSFQELQIDTDGEENPLYSKINDKQNPFPDYSPVLETVQNLAGEWGTHRFDKEAWYKSKPFAVVKQNRRNISYEDTSEDENEEISNEYEETIEESSVLTDDMIKASLSYLERSPIVLKYVLCKCVLSNKDLRDINGIKYYHYIQYLDISKNDLTSLAALSQLPFLQYLDASYNYLENVLDFKAPFFLASVNLSHNLIRIIPDLTEFWSLTDLNLSYNSIEKISGLENLRFLNYLDLSHNKISALENLNYLRIQILILHHNLIDSNNVDDDPVLFKTLDYIRLVDLSHNNISSLEMFQNASYIEGIDMSNNNISSLLELYHLCNLRYLSRLNLMNNPVTTMKYYFNVCVENIKHLIILDGKKICPEKRIHITNTFTPLFPGKVSHAELMLLQQINYPNIDSFLLPINHPHPIIIVLVGPPGSRKSYIARKFCRTNKMLVYGVSYTTRPRVEGEVEGENYYFITTEEFRNLARTGKFIAVSEFNGHSFGIAYEEIYKAVDKILVFHSDITAAVTLKTRAVNPKLVLAIPKSELIHLKWLREKYFFNET